MREYLGYDNRLTPAKTPRVIAVGPMPPEKSAYALARYSRSPDSIRDSIEWVRTHDSAKFLESFYFQYGHASIADLGHVILCFEGISELAATEIEDEQLWDGQARSSRYQDFSRSGFVTPRGLSESDADSYGAAARRLLEGYLQIHARLCDHLSDKLPRPDAMKPDVYKRNIAARAFDVARYVLFLGIPTGVGQVTSIRTLEKQVRRFKASPYAELQELAGEVAEACASPPACVWDLSSAREGMAPTLARHLEPDQHLNQCRKDLECWASQNLPPAAPGGVFEMVDLLRPAETHADIAATLLYPVTTRSFRELYQMARDWSAAQRNEVIDVALRSRGKRDDLLREFRGGLYAFDMVIDIGAYRDLHRHRRCHQFRQAYGGELGFDTPGVLVEAGLKDAYDTLMTETSAARSSLPSAAAEYLLPFASRSRFLFKMDFAEAEYIARVRSGVKGHFSYRRVAWEMKCKMEQLEPELGRLMEATPPWVEDPLTR
ncbi:MAG: FAD-dependent thymidylate synthase [Bryobacteraceae bacterium]|jgi:thymidylate synthase ThyX